MYVLAPFYCIYENFIMPQQITIKCMDKIYIIKILDRSLKKLRKYSILHNFLKPTFIYQFCFYYLRHNYHVT